MEPKTSIAIRITIAEQVVSAAIRRRQQGLQEGCWQVTFLAFSNSGDVETGISYEDRDETEGVLGKLTTSQKPIAEAETRDEITQAAYAFLGRNPSGSIYITDSRNRLLEIVINQKYHADLTAQTTSKFTAWVLLVFCVASFFGTAKFGNPRAGLGIFLGIALLYGVLVRLRIFNLVESTIYCAILLILLIGCLGPLILPT